ncbi:acyl-CoA thioesterase [Rudaeicoccus suwonensis]|uniref:Acyl-CoA thioesterase-2 n=1 Tax=Rudaeicoccus suwonensis TaxID=657409 RepID=A0A561E387_9MICO|nr:acyl-CoA thioesterase domain-containing protein [Rudaeicoccus suwonensis]TWE10060.1 acyl-CoA thioesterase-2 [Rudaeicoccus suwonensis]
MTEPATADRLRRALALNQVEPDAETAGVDEVFEGISQWVPWPKAYGGDLVAQAAVAMMRTAPADKTMHSMHSYFMRPVDIDAPVRYSVERVRDGRGYATRAVRGIQNGKEAYRAMASFHACERGGSFAASMPEVPAAGDLPSSQDYLDAVDASQDTGTMTPESREYWSTGRSFDMRHVPGPVYLTVDGGRQPHQAVWIRPFADLGQIAGLTEQQRDVAALAYACDYTILEPVLRVLGHAWAEPGLVTASLDHAMWFHRPAAVNGWLLYAQEAVAADAGRGLGLGRFFTADGVHVATVAQEGMLRVP